MSDIKLPVKHTSLYKAAKNSACLTKFASLPNPLSGKCRHIIDNSEIGADTLFLGKNLTFKVLV